MVHCRTEAEAEKLKVNLAARLAECGLELHPTKTRVVYCQDSNRRKKYPTTSFDFLGYTFRPRRSVTKEGRRFLNFTPAVSGKAQTSMRQAVHDWRLHLHANRTLEELAQDCNPIVRGWMQYYGVFYKSALGGVYNHINRALVLWARRKYKPLRRSQKRAKQWLGRLARREPALFVHWQAGGLPTVE